jgi:hypothetical protein
MPASDMARGAASQSDGSDESPGSWLLLSPDLVLQRDIDHLGFLLFRFNAFSVRLR